jgi:exodeoxyribonuclease-3
VLGGDFNLCPAAIDSHDEATLTGHIFHTEAERTRFRALERWGLVDLFRAQHPELRAFSWWDYRGGAFHKGEGLRIDFLLGTAPVLARCAASRSTASGAQQSHASDHAPGDR